MINIISQLSGLPLVRALVILVLIFLFVALPFRFHRYEDAIAIDIGIIAATLLFFGQTYYFAIPLILIATVLFEKKKLGLTLSYYVLISVPLQLIEYLKYILTLSNVYWWEDPTADPFLYVPLTEIFKDIQESMTQIRLVETAKVIETIAGQVTFSPGAHMAQTTEAVLTRYFDSLPGIVLFLVIVIGLVSATAFITRALVTKSYAMHAEMLLPAMTAASATALFFLFLSGLQDPLAFRAEIDSSQMVIGTLAASIFTILASLANYSPKKRATIEMRSKMIMEKAQDLITKLQVFESLLNKVKSGIPIDVSSTEGKMLMIKDKLDDTLSKTSARFYDLSELDEKFNELDKGISNEINNLMSELNVTLIEYQVYVNSEYSAWIKKLKDIGLDVKTTAKTDFQKELPLEMRVDVIKEVLEGGRFLATGVIQVVEQIYDIIRSLYDPKLPEESLTITFAKQKLDEKTALWIALDALFTSLNSWEKQYSAEISKSVEYLQKSLTSIVNLSTQSERLLPVLGDNFSKLMNHTKRAEAIKIGIEKNTLKVMNVLIIRDALQSSLRIARDVLSILYEELTSKEESIESLLLTRDYLWEKNVALRERMASEMEIIFNPSKYKLTQVMENLPKSLSYLDECVETIAMYNEKKELLLNYPIAKTAIEDLLKEKKHISAQDLPFEPEYAKEYLKLFYSQRYREFSFDKANMLLMKKE